MKVTVMMTPQAVLGYVKAEPFRPFRIHLLSDRTFDIRHPEMIKVRSSIVVVYKTTGDIPEFPDECETVSLMLIESISYLETSVR